MDILYEHTVKRQEARIQALENLVKTQSQLVDKLLVTHEGTSPTTGDMSITQKGANNTVQVDNRKTLNINIFGNEDCKHATSERIRTILDESLLSASLAEAAQTAVLKTAMLLYSNPEHPENLTCYLPNKKTNDALVHGKDGWEVQPVSMVMRPISQKSINIIFDKQPYDEAVIYGPLMRELADNEVKYTTGLDIRTILIRNKDLVCQVLGALPTGGKPRKKTSTGTPRGSNSSPPMLQN